MDMYNGIVCKQWVPKSQRETQREVSVGSDMRNQLSLGWYSKGPRGVKIKENRIRMPVTQSFNVFGRYTSRVSKGGSSSSKRVTAIVRGVETKDWQEWPQFT